ncbi:MAG TPA: AsmA family protein [Steroidobacteraceae bacterium]
MRIVRFALLGLGVLLLLVLAAAVYLVLFFDPNSHKAELQRLVHEQTGRELELPGELSLKLFPWVAIETGRAVLGNAAGFGTEPMVEIEHARLGLKLLPLLHRKVEVAAVRLDAPTIRLAVDASGRSNWADLGGKSTAPAAKSEGGALSSLSVAGVQINRGTVLYVDRSAGTEIGVHELNVSSGPLAPGKAFDLQLSGTVEEGKSLSVALRVSGRATVNSAASRYQLASPVFALQLKGKGLPAAGLPVQLRFERIDADLAAQTLELPGLDMGVAGARLTGALRGTAILDAPRITGPLHLADVSLRELLRSLDISLPVTRDAAAFGRIGLDGQLAASSHAVLLNDLKLRFDDTTANGHGGIADLDRMALAFDLDLDRINADRYLAPAAPAASPAAAGGGRTTATRATALPIPVALIRSLDVHGTLAVREAVFAGIQYSRLHLGINAAGGRLRIFPSEAQMYGGQYHGDVTVDASGKLPRVSFDEHVTGVDFAPLFSDMFETRRVSGRGNAAIKAAGTGADSAALLRTLTGTVEFHVDNGALEGADLWYEIRRARALLKQQPIPARSGPERTPFTAFSATGRISNGVLSNEDLIAALQYLQVKGRGSADIAAGTLDYHLDVLVLNIPEEGSSATDEHDLVGLKLPVLISGTFGAPKVRPDVNGLVKARVQEELDKKKEELKQKLKDKLQDKLKGLLGG